MKKKPTLFELQYKVEFYSKYLEIMILNMI